MGLKLLTVTELIISHILLLAGLILLTVGLLLDPVSTGLIVAGMWAVALGLCISIGTALKKLAEK
ncbi:hypothetical protein ACFLTS_01340 [Chloroflexota bacterium]